MDSDLEQHDEECEEGKMTYLLGLTKPNHCACSIRTHRRVESRIQSAIDKFHNRQNGR